MFNAFKASLRDLNSTQSNNNSSDENVELWKTFSELLEHAGYTDVPEKKGQISEAAKCLIINRLNITPSQLDELLYPRKQREKTAKKLT